MYEVGDYVKNIDIATKKKEKCTFCEKMYIKLVALLGNWLLVTTVRPLTSITHFHMSIISFLHWQNQRGALMEPILGQSPLPPPYHSLLPPPSTLSASPRGGRGRHVEESNELLCLHFLRVQNALSRSQRFQPNSAPSQLAWTAERRDRGAFQQHFLRILNFLRTMTGPPQAQFTAHIRPCVCEKDLLWQWTTTPTNEFIKRETGQRISPILWGGACVSDWNEQEFSPQTIKGTCEYDLCGLNRKC